ncbi:MAG: 50S ribosomal protein L29 [Candidatus Obscuribacterales bacterium]|jgi:large subunit ribosomal protein L29
MKVAEIKDLSADELNARITDTRKEIVDLRFQLGARKLEKPHKIRDARKLLSRLLTVQTQKHNDEIAKAGDKEAKAAKAEKPAAKAKAKTK